MAIRFSQDPAQAWNKPIGNPSLARNSFFKGVTGAANNSGSTIPRFKKGGKVKKTGPAIVHKGERVLSAKQTKSFDRKFKAVTGRIKKKMSPR